MDTNLLKGRLAARMSNGEPFSFLNLQAIAGEQWRVADSMMQSWRRKGWIAFKREGRTPVWSMTEAGRATLASSADTGGGQHE